MGERGDFGRLNAGLESDFDLDRFKLISDDCDYLADEVGSMKVSTELNSVGGLRSDRVRLQGLLDNCASNKRMVHGNISSSLFSEMSDNFSSQDLGDEFSLSSNFFKQDGFLSMTSPSSQLSGICSDFFAHNDNEEGFPSLSTDLNSSLDSDLISPTKSLVATGKNGLKNSLTNKVTSESVVQKTVSTRVIEAETSYASENCQKGNTLSMGSSARSSQVQGSATRALQQSSTNSTKQTNRRFKTPSTGGQRIFGKQTLPEQRLTRQKLLDNMPGATAMANLHNPALGDRITVVNKENHSSVVSSATVTTTTNGSGASGLVPPPRADVVARSGGPRSSFQSHVSRTCQRQQTEALSTGGVTHVRRQQERSDAQARVQVGPDGVGHVDATLNQQRRQAEAVTEAGVTRGYETADARKQQRRADVLVRDGGKKIVPVSVSGNDSHRQMALQYCHEGGQLQIQPMQGFGSAGSLPGFGLLIVPPVGGKLSCRIGVRGVESSFQSLGEQAPRIETHQWSVSGSYQLSESEDSDGSDIEALAPGAKSARLGYVRRKRLSWLHKPALEYKPPRGKTQQPPEERVEAVESEVVTSAAPQIAEDRERCDRLQKRLHNIALELLSTERVYVQRLYLIDQIFRSRVEEANTAQRMFSAEVIAKMFSNSGAIYRFHQEHLLPQLESRLSDWPNNPRIGDIMKENAPFLKMYAEYITGYNNAMRLVETFCIKNSRFAALVSKIQEMEECVGLPLSHHMIVPIQRVPRYEMLLKDYSNRLPDDSPDSADVREALDLVMHAASHCNEMVRGEERLQKLIQIQRSVTGAGDLVSPTRQLIKQGPVSKISARGGEHQDRYLFLLSDMLLLCSSRLRSTLMSAASYRLRARFDIQSMQVTEGDNLETPNTFYVVSGDRKVELYTESAAEKLSWLDSVCSCLTDLHANRAADQLHTVSPSALGLSRPAQLRPEMAARCMVCDAQFTLVRRRYCCRACGLVVCSKCSPHRAALPYNNNKTTKLRVCGSCHEHLDKGGSSPICPPTASTPAMTYTRGQSVLHVPAAESSLLSGWLEIRVGRGWKRRWFCLRDSAILFSYTDQNASQALTAALCPGLACIWMAAASAATASETPPPPSSSAVPGTGCEKEKDRVFKLVRDNRCFLLRGDSKDDVSRWLSAIKKVSRFENISSTAPSVHSADSASESLSTDV